MYSDQSRSPSLAQEAFLAEVASTLEEGLTPLEVRENLAEIREHLLALTSAYEELECTEEEASVMALRKFGDPGVIAAEILHFSSTRRRIHLLGKPLGPEKALASALALALTITLGTPIVACGEILLAFLAHSRLPDLAVIPLAAMISAVVTSFSWSFPKWAPIKLAALACAFAAIIALAVTVATHRAIGTSIPGSADALRFVAMAFVSGYAIQVLAWSVRRITDRHISLRTVS